MVGIDIKFTRQAIQISTCECDPFVTNACGINLQFYTKRKGIEKSRLTNPLLVTYMYLMYD